MIIRYTVDDQRTMRSSTRLVILPIDYRRQMHSSAAATRGCGFRRKFSRTRAATSLENPRL